MMAGRSPAWRRRLVAELTGAEDRSQHLLRAAKVIQDALAEAGLRMTVVGGSAVTAYDPDAHTSLDIDLVGAGLAARLDEVLREHLGLAHEGRHWFDEELGIAVERPGSTLEPPGAEAITLGHYDSWAQAVRLARSETTDQERLHRRAAEVRLEQYLAFALWLQDEHAAGRSKQGEVARYVHELNTRAAAQVITRVLDDRTAAT